MDKILHQGKYYTEDEIRVIVETYYRMVFSRKNDRHMQMQKLFPDSLDSNSKILDYGCGMGGVSQLFFEKYGSKVDGVEISGNELKKAKITYGNNKNIDFILLDKYDFPVKNYDLIFSSQVIEHVHNPGNYLSKINSMLKDDGYLLIGLPNIVNMHYFLNLIFYSQKRAVKYSKKMCESYNKAGDHINGRDPVHFITLLVSCGFELVEYLPTEGTSVSLFLKRVPWIGRYIYNLPFTTRLSYTMFFLPKKSKRCKYREL